jgi:beta-galactosidase
MSSLFRAVIAVGVLLVIVSALWSSLYSASPHSSLRLLAKRAVPSLYHDPNDNKTWKVPSKLLIASATDGRFHLNSIAKRIISGEFHYFRTHPAQWDDRLRRLRTAGLNTITTRIPWNIHEKRRGVFEFNGFWNLSQFIQTVHRLGLLLIVDIGPYIDADWEFGGLPYWLLHDADMVVRSSSYPPYMNYVERYMGQLLTVLTRYTYKRHGPIIAVQIENELGSYTTD